MKKSIISLITFFIFLFNVTYASSTIPVWSSTTKRTNDLAVKTVAENKNPLGLTCGGAVLIEQNSGNVLYDHNMHEKLRPASVTKVMSILLIMEALDNGKIKLSDKIPCSEEAASMGGSQIWLNTTEELTVEEMLKAICIVSANDCVVAMADYLEGSQDAFVKKMNLKAEQLGMKDTTFKNCHGIDEDGHLTSAYDIALMSKELLSKHPEIKKYTTIYMDTLRNGQSQLVNTNKLVKNYNGCTGLKTGSTSIALYNLSASATRDNLSLIAVIMKGNTSQERFNEAKKLLDYGFSNYQYVNISNKDDFAGICKIKNGVIPEINVVYKDNYGVVMPKSKDSQTENKIEIYESANAPISKGDKLGTANFYYDKKLIGSIDLVASESVDKYTFSKITKKIYSEWFKLLR